MTIDINVCLTDFDTRL